MELTKTLIARTSNSYIDPFGCKHESLPQFFHELVAPTQLKCIYEAGDFRQHWQLWIHISGRIRNQVLPEGIFSVPDYKGASIIFSRRLFTSLREVGCRRSLTPTNQVFRGEAVDRERIGGVLENAGLSRIFRE